MTLPSPRACSAGAEAGATGPCGIRRDDLGALGGRCCALAAELDCPVAAGRSAAACGGACSAQGKFSCTLYNPCTWYNGILDS